MNDPIVATTLQRIQTDPQGESPIATAYFEKKTVIDGQTWLRPCFTNFRTTPDDVRMALAVAAELGATVCATH